jgi:prepilin-type N-terminal cleavage/methylation domain-containing protein
MKVQPSIGPNAGFTLVESMLTVAIMGVGLLALAGLQITALRGNDLSRRMTTAVAIAEQSIEQLKNTPYTNIQAEAASEVTASNLHFTRQVTVTNGPLPNTKSVSVLVSWQDQSKTHTLPIATIIGQ